MTGKVNGGASGPADRKDKQMETGTATITRTTPDAQKVFAAIAAIISRREGRTVRLVSVERAQGKNAERKAG